MTASPNTRHQVVSGNLHFLLRTWIETHPVGRVIYAPYDIVFSNFDVVEPDLVYVSNERAAQIITPMHAVGSPDLVIEIGSPSTRKRDETIKRRLYERTGVAEYWVVDPDLEALRVYRRAGNRFDKAVELSAESGDVLRTPLLPELDLQLSKIFAG